MSWFGTGPRYTGHERGDGVPFPATAPRGPAVLTRRQTRVPRFLRSLGA
jgi:hypothetical protein